CPLQSDALVAAVAVVIVPRACGSQAREGGLEVAAEGLLGAMLVAADAVAPCAPRLIEQLDRHSEAGPDDAAVVHEPLDRPAPHLKVLDGLARAGGLGGVAALA